VRIVLDTSVLIAALRSGRGAAAENLRLVLLERLTLLLDYSLVCEYRDVALREEHLQASGRSAAEVAHIVNMLEAIAEPVYVQIRHRPLSQDESDDCVLDVAINGGAEAIVTYNTRHFSRAAARFGLRVLTPAQLPTVFRDREEGD